MDAVGLQAHRLDMAAMIVWGIVGLFRIPFFGCVITPQSGVL